MARYEHLPTLRRQLETLKVLCRLCQDSGAFAGGTGRFHKTCVIGRVVRLRRDHHEWDLTGGLWPLIHWCAALPAAWGVRLCWTARCLDCGSSGEASGRFQSPFG